MEQEYVMTPGELKALPIEQRVATYIGLTLSLIVAADTGMHAPLSDGEMNLIGYGIFRDPEAKEWARANADQISSAGDPSEFFDYGNIIRLMELTNDPRLALEKVDTREARDTAVISKWDTIEDEPIFLPLATAAVVAAATGAAGAGAYGATMQAAWAISSRAIGWLPSAMRTWAIAHPAIGGAAVTVASGAIKTGIVGAGAVTLSGLFNTAASVFDNIANTEENVATRMDVDTMAAASMLSTDEIERQRELPLAERTIEAMPSEIAAAGGVTQQAVEEAPLSSQMYLSDGPPPAAGASPADDPRIRVGEGYDPKIGRGSYYRPPDEEGAPPGEGRYDRKKIGVRYHDSDLEYMLSAMTPGRLIAFQNLAQTALLLDPGGTRGQYSYTPGQLDVATEAALSIVLGQANMDGKDWWDTLTQMAKDGRERNKLLDDMEAESNRRPPYVRDAYLEPNYDDLKTEVENVIEANLGRKANEWEKQLLADKLAEYRYEDFDSQQRAMQLAYEADGRAIETNEPQSVPNVEAMDVDMRFEAFFEDKFEGELDRKDRVEQVEQSTGDLMRGFDNAASAIGGR